MDLQNFRTRIDEIDSQLVKLLDERASIARAVGETKAVGGLNTYDAGRQRGVLQKALEMSAGDIPRDGLANVFREILSACLNLQKPLRVGYLGPPATFSHQAAIREFGHSVRFESTQSIRELFEMLDDGRVEHSVVPVENSTGGIIHDTLDAFLDSQAMICAEILMPIEQSLVGVGTLERVRTVYSHRQGLMQCAEWLRANLPDADLQEVASTARAMEMVATNRNAAAIGSRIGAEMYGLRVLAPAIEDMKDNTTRFLVLAKRDSRATGRDRTSLMFGVRDKPGALYRALQQFSERDLNLTKIESRPSRKNAWEQIFFVDVEGHREDAPLADTLRALEAECPEVRVLGSYPREGA
ncbi:MAG: prephenate dehydratase [Candidatus Sumerlaeia bacterium]|nr:prephenate dehydratase [Candidatus Sumerlaeia bacterium]